MHTYNTDPPVDELSRAHSELNQVKDIMVQNVEQILSRGERIELLVDKTDVMAGQATAFRRGARTARRQMWWRNQKVMALSILAGLVSLPLQSTIERSLIIHLIIGATMDDCSPILWGWLEPLHCLIDRIKTKLSRSSPFMPHTLL